MYNDDVTFVIVGQKLDNNMSFQKAIKQMPGKKCYSGTGFEFIHNSESSETIFVLDNFDGSLFQQLNKKGCRIVAPQVIIKCLHIHERLPVRLHPLYCTMMKDAIVCFSGFKFEEMSHLVDLVHYLGGSIRKDFSAEVTHLVTNKTSGKKYRAAVNLGTSILSKEWILKCWEERDDNIGPVALLYTMQFKLRTFQFAVISFYGFLKEDQRFLEELAVSNGGSVADLQDPMTTHLVISDRLAGCRVKVSNNTFAVNSEWLLASIMMDACADETMYLFAMPNSQGSPSFLDATDDASLPLDSGLKLTESSNSSHHQLDKTVRGFERGKIHVKEVEQHIENHRVMFDILRDIENCPANILSSDRNFVRKVDAIEITEELSGRGSLITLFVFSDSVEICKRVKLANGKRKSSGALVATTRVQSQQPYKHLAFIHASCIKRIVDICEPTDCRKMFALITKKIDEQEKLYVFSIVDQTTYKEDALMCICDAVCTTMCLTDCETILTVVDSQAVVESLNLDTSDTSGDQTLCRASTRLDKKVSRVSPLNRMKRAILSITSSTSPLRRDASIGGIFTDSMVATGGFNDRDENAYRYSEIVDQLAKRCRGRL